MYTFRQYVEALASHGGYWLQRDQKSKGAEAKGKDIKWSFPDYANWDYFKIHKTTADLEAEKTHRVLTRNYKDVISKLDEKLMKLGDVDFHIYFGLPENIKALINSNTFNDRAEVETVLADYFFNEMNIPKNDVVFVKSGASGDILTPWIVLHTIGHAMTDSKVLKNYDKKWNDLWKMLSDLNIMHHSVVSCIFNFRSARTHMNKKRSTMFNAVPDLLELRHELVASYLWNGGHIKRPEPECIAKIYHNGGIVETLKYSRLSDEEITEKLTSLVNQFYDEADKLIKESLDALRGHVLIDLFPYVSNLKNI